MSEIAVNLGDVFYKVERTDWKYYSRKCRVCEGNRELTVNGITFKCPMCGREQETLRVCGYKVTRYRVYQIENYIGDYDWKRDTNPPQTRYLLYHKSGRGHFTSDCVHKTATVGSYMFLGRSPYFNNQNPSPDSVESCLYSDYKLAVAVANALTEQQIDKVRAYNAENNTDYPLPVFLIEHDKKSK